ncbi:hypothetical protein TYRP_006375 [Tyrophagus putrescentiae]|nr:hypothetical protein TYRP_006375 [Tyrophagus putrescentiae]
MTPADRFEEVRTWASLLGVGCCRPPPLAAASASARIFAAVVGDHFTGPSSSDSKAPVRGRKLLAGALPVPRTLETTEALERFEVRDEVVEEAEETEAVAEAFRPLALLAADFVAAVVVVVVVFFFLFTTSISSTSSGLDSSSTVSPVFSASSSSSSSIMSITSACFFATTSSIVLTVFATVTLAGVVEMSVRKLAIEEEAVQLGVVAAVLLNCGCCPFLNKLLRLRREEKVRFVPFAVPLGSAGSSIAPAGAATPLCGGGTGGGLRRLEPVLEVVDALRRLQRRNQPVDGDHLLHVRLQQAPIERLAAAEARSGDDVRHQPRLELGDEEGAAAADGISNGHRRVLVKAHREDDGLVEEGGRAGGGVAVVLLRRARRHRQRQLVQQVRQVAEVVEVAAQALGGARGAAAASVRGHYHRLIDRHHRHVAGVNVVVVEGEGVASAHRVRHPLEAQSGDVLLLRVDVLLAGGRAEHQHRIEGVKAKGGAVRAAVLLNLPPHRLAVGDHQIVKDGQGMSAQQLGRVRPHQVVLVGGPATFHPLGAHHGNFHAVGGAVLVRSDAPSNQQRHRRVQARAVGAAHHHHPRLEGLARLGGQTGGGDHQAAHALAEEGVRPHGNGGEGLRTLLVAVLDHVRADDAGARL